MQAFASIVQLGVCPTQKRGNFSSILVFMYSAGFLFVLFYQIAAVSSE